jgi:uncharacterized protein (DUF305 family)
MHKHHYGHLAIMTVLSFISMYVFMYAMVDRFENVFPNINQFYMAGVMTAPMVIIELIVMRSMYKNTAFNIAILAGSAIALVAFFLLIRQQTAVTDVQFVKSMIPHHGAAVLMCEKAPIADAEIKTLCKAITSSQTSEIAQMKTILQRLNR